MKPLSGIRVLDLSRILAGPFCSMMLGDYGAEVIKVEHVDRGDDTRTWGPPFSSSGHESAYFLGINRSKKSIGIDLKQSEGVQLVRRLAVKCDVVLENFIPGKADELGIGYKDLAVGNKKLVYGSLSGYGSDGPLSKALAYDVMISAIGGLLGITGSQSGDVCKVGVAITDICAGLVLHGAIIAALLYAERFGMGQHVETSLLDTQISCLANIASAYLVSGVVVRPQGTAHASIVPYQAFHCLDKKQIIIGALNDTQFQRLCAAIQRSELGTNPKFMTNPQRVTNRDELLSILFDVIRQRPAAEWLMALEKAQVPCAPINNVEEVFQHPQVVHRQRVLQVEHPTVGLLKMVAPPATFHGTPLGTSFLPPPLLGQHTSEVLRTLLQLSPEELEHLKEKKIVCQHPNHGAYVN